MTHYNLRLLQLLLLMALWLGVTADQPKQPEDGPLLEESEEFSQEQLARARQRMSSLFDEGLDADKDGSLTREELLNWLAKSAREQAERDLEDNWRLHNVTDPERGLDWDSYASHRAARLATSDLQDDEAAEAATASLQAEVRRAIDEASRETGLDKAGIKVAVPQLPAQQPKKAPMKKSGDESEADQQQLAMELTVDRRRWDAADADGDGRLSRREFADFAFADGSATAGPRMRAVLALEALERMDADGDGRVSEAEFLAEAAAGAGEAEAEARNFRDVWDVNKDGYMEAAEMEKMLDYLDSPGGGVSDFRRAEELEQHAKEADQLIASADADKDGSLSRAEVLAGLAAFAGSAATDYGDAVGMHDEL